MCVARVSEQVASETSANKLRERASRVGDKRQQVVDFFTRIARTGSGGVNNTSAVCSRGGVVHGRVVRQVLCVCLGVGVGVGVYVCTHATERNERRTFSVVMPGTLVLGSTIAARVLHASRTRRAKESCSPSLNLVYL